MNELKDASTHFMRQVEVDMKVESPQKEEFILCHAVLQLPIEITDLKERF